jgi:hypothetical protein
MIVTTTMLATHCSDRKYPARRADQGDQGLPGIAGRESASQPPVTPAPNRFFAQRGTDMLALASAAHGQDPTQLLIIFGALVAAAFWRFVLKIALAIAIIAFAILVIHVIHGETALVADLSNAVR